MVTLTLTDNQLPQAYVMPSIAATHGVRNPITLMFMLLRDGTVLPENMCRIKNAFLLKQKRMEFNSIPDVVFADYCDVGFVCWPMPSYFDLFLTECTIAYLEHESLEEKAERTIDYLLDDRLNVFSVTRSEPDLPDIWLAPSVKARYRFLIQHISRLGSGLRPDRNGQDIARDMLIPDVPWLLDLERTARRLTLKETSKPPGAIAEMIRGPVPSKALARLQAKVLEELMRMEQE